jgi:hypothetical protein
MGNTLMTLVMQAAEELGFLRKNEDGQLVEGEGGTLGYLKWIGINKPDRFVALMARVAPKHVFADVTHRAVSLTASEIEAELRDRGLPPELLDSLRNIPDDVLDWDEDVPTSAFPPRRCARWSGPRRLRGVPPPP